MQLYNSMTGRKERFQPADPNRVTMYVCGPTVYSYAHIGNARPAVVFDVLFRLLRQTYPQVVYARNLTDIDDKIIQAAAAQSVPTEVITERFAAAYNADMAALNVLPPTLEPRATQHVPQMLAMIERLLASGAAYEAEGHVLFHVPSFPSYGALSKRSREEMIDGARVEVAPYKRDPADFVLWKPSTPEQPGWDSRFGRGRPGWHLECSVMIESHLGETIDIHAGGIDLKFPHHENEIAQSACAHGGRALARFWLHNGFLDIEDEKMSKSLGNVLLPHDLLQEVPGEAIRFALLAAHYRKPLNWTRAGLDRARHALDRLYLTLRRLPAEAGPAAAPPASIVAVLADDLNTPKAQAALFDLAREANSTDDPARQAVLKGELLAAGNLLGLLQVEPEQWLRQGSGGEPAIDSAAIERLLAERQAARLARDFELADRIRDQLAAEGVIIEDGPAASRWRLAG